MALRFDAPSMLSPANSARRVRVRYSRFVGMMKIALPAVAAGLIGLLVLWPNLQRTSIDHGAPNKGRPGVNAVDTSSMINPRYYGTDDQNRPFTVTAKSATQVDAKQLSVGLDHPDADFTRPDGTGVIASADYGLYSQKANTLDLKGAVSVYLDSGYELHTEMAHVDVAQGTVTGSGPFTSQGPTGLLEGQGFAVADRGGNVQCTGKCRAVLNLGKH